MKTPETTPDKPYIEFRFDKNGNLKLDTTSLSWHGGYFFATDGSEGGSCLPKNLNRSITAFKKRKIREIEKEIATLQKQLNKWKSE